MSTIVPANALEPLCGGEELNPTHCEMLVRQVNRHLQDHDRKHGTCTALKNVDAVCLATGEAAEKARLQFLQAACLSGGADVRQEIREVLSGGRLAAEVAGMRAGLKAGQYDKQVRFGGVSFMGGTMTRAQFARQEQEHSKRNDEQSKRTQQERQAAVQQAEAFNRAAVQQAEAAKQAAAQQAAAQQVAAQQVAAAEQAKAASRSVQALRQQQPHVASASDMVQRQLAPAVHLQRQQQALQQQQQQNALVADAHLPAELRGPLQQSRQHIDDRLAQQKFESAGLATGIRDEVSKANHSGRVENQRQQEQGRARERGSHEKADVNSAHRAKELQKQVDMRRDRVGGTGREAAGVFGLSAADWPAGHMQRGRGGMPYRVLQDRDGVHYWVNASVMGQTYPQQNAPFQTVATRHGVPEVCIGSPGLGWRDTAIPSDCCVTAPRTRAACDTYSFLPSDLQTQVCSYVKKQQDFNCAATDEQKAIQRAQFHQANGLGAQYGNNAQFQQANWFGLPQYGPTQLQQANGIGLPQYGPQYGNGFPNGFANGNSSAWSHTMVSQQQANAAAMRTQQQQEHAIRQAYQQSSVNFQNAARLQANPNPDDIDRMGASLTKTAITAAVPTMVFGQAANTVAIRYDGKGKGRIRQIIFEDTSANNTVAYAGGLYRGALPSSWAAAPSQQEVFVPHGNGIMVLDSNTIIVGRWTYHSSQGGIVIVGVKVVHRKQGAQAWAEVTGGTFTGDTSYVPTPYDEAAHAKYTINQNGFVNRVEDGGAFVTSVDSTQGIAVDTPQLETNSGVKFRVIGAEAVGGLFACVPSSTGDNKQWGVKVCMAPVLSTWGEYVSGEHVTPNVYAPVVSVGEFDTDGRLMEGWEGTGAGSLRVENGNYKGTYWGEVVAGVPHGIGGYMGIATKVVDFGGLFTAGQQSAGGKNLVYEKADDDDAQYGIYVEDVELSVGKHKQATVQLLNIAFKGAKLALGWKTGMAELFTKKNLVAAAAIGLAVLTAVTFAPAAVSVATMGMLGSAGTATVGWGAIAAATTATITAFAKDSGEKLSTMWDYLKNNIWGTNPSTPKVGQSTTATEERRTGTIGQLIAGDEGDGGGELDGGGGDLQQLTEGGGNDSTQVVTGGDELVGGSLLEDLRNAKKNWNNNTGDGSDAIQAKIMVLMKLETDNVLSEEEKKVVKDAKAELRIPDDSSYEKIMNMLTVKIAEEEKKTKQPRKNSQLGKKTAGAGNLLAALRQNKKSDEQEITTTQNAQVDAPQPAAPQPVAAPAVGHAIPSQTLAQIKERLEQIDREIQLAGAQTDMNADPDLKRVQTMMLHCATNFIKYTAKKGDAPASYTVNKEVFQNGIKDQRIYDHLKHIKTVLDAEATICKLVKLKSTSSKPEVRQQAYFCGLLLYALAKFVKENDQLKLIPSLSKAAHAVFRCVRDVVAKSMMCPIANGKVSKIPSQHHEYDLYKQENQTADTEIWKKQLKQLPFLDECEAVVVGAGPVGPQSGQAGES